MRVVMLAAGAGGMICGSCLRDNRLAATLRAAGRDVVLVPLYTPLRIDEADASSGPVYYGGINVYLQQRSAVFRALPRVVDRVLDAAPLLRAASGGGISVRAAEVADLTLSVLRGAEGRQRKELERLIDALRPMRPALVVLPNLLFAGVARPLKAALGVPVLCTMSGEDLFLDELPEGARDEAERLIGAAVDDIDAFIAVSAYYAHAMCERFNLPAYHVEVVRMGIAVDDFSLPPSPPESEFTIGYLARICHAKGLHRLVDAFLALRRNGRRCRLRVAGYLAPADRSYLDEQIARIRQSGAAAEFEYAGELSRAKKAEFLSRLHAFSVPTVYREAKGLYVLEALAAGVPVVQPRHGSFTELIHGAGVGILYDPAGPDGLTAGLSELMDDEPRRRTLGATGRAVVRERNNDRVMAEQAWTLFERCARVD